MALFSLSLILLYAKGSIIGSLFFGAFPLMICTKIYVLKTKIARMHVKEMYAIFRYSKDTAPELRRVEIKDISDQSKFFYLRQFNRLTDFEVTRIQKLSKSLRRVTEDFRCFKV